MARGVLYFSARWGADIEEGEEAVLRAWAADDPPDDRERARNDAIEGIQGNRNPFIDCPGLLDDFIESPPTGDDRQLPLP